jgi:hypothetical protein
MITLSGTQETILSAGAKRVTWLFEVTAGATTYYWSTKAYTFGGQAYTFAVLPDSFSGITMQRARSEMGLQGPTTLKFAAVNKGNLLSPGDFVAGSVLVKLVMKAGANEAVIRSWRFRIETCSNLYQCLNFDCVDFLQAVLDGRYPNTPLVKDTFLSKNTDQETDVCVPLPFGECYVPLRPVYAGGSLGYLIGPDGPDYTITEVRSPRSWGAKSTWSSADYTMADAVETDPQARDWTLIYPRIARSRGDLAAPDVTGIWQEGERFLDIPAQFSRDDTDSLTDPADVLEYILSDTDDGMGLAAGDLDVASFTAAGVTYAGWGLEWNGALWKHEAREKILSRLLCMCHSVLDVGATLSLRVLSKTSKMTVTKALVIGERGQPGFTMTATAKRNADGGYVEWQEAGEAQDEFYKTLVPVKEGSAPTRQGTDTMACPWVQDSQLVQALATLHFQRRYLPAGECAFVTKAGIAGEYPAALQPDDVITIDEPDYGGTYDALVDSVTIRRGGAVEIRCMPLSDDLDDFGDLSPSALVYNEPSADNTWQGATTGPTVPSGMMPNEAKGDLVLKAGANIILDGGAIKNNDQSTFFEISELAGIMSKGGGVKMATLMGSAYDTSPLEWFSEASFVEVCVTTAHASATTKFYSDAFKLNVTGDLTVTAVLDMGDSYKITFTGATLTENAQVGNLIEPDWGSAWVKYTMIAENGTDWVRVSKAKSLFGAPVATDTFSIHGVYANTIMTWQQPYALWFTLGSNIANAALLATGASAVDTATGLVTLASAMPYNIVAGDRLKAYDFRVLFDYGWNNSRVILAPSSRAPGAMYLYIGAGGTHPGAQWQTIFMRALNGIDLCPAFGSTAKTVRVVNQNSSWPADFEVTLGDLLVRDGRLMIKDGITAPAAAAGFMTFYVDTADGDLKVIFGDGTVKTIATDS